MKVYIVMVCMAYEGGRIAEVFANRTDAEQFAKYIDGLDDFADSKWAGYDFTKIVEKEVL